MTHRIRYGFAVAVFSTALAVSACSGSGTTSGRSASAAKGPSAATTAAAAAQPEAPTQNPLTGGKPTRNGVVAVKIDDTGNGRPQVNIDQADIVYIEQVEGGLSRLLAVYNSSLPTVEAVRSARASDPELVAQYGRIAYVASGGAHNPLKVLDASRLRTAINDRGGPGFQRDGSRSAPYNLRANLADIAKKLKAPPARPVGFHWAADTAQLKGARTAAHVRTEVGTTPVAFDYDAKTQRYQRVINGVAQRTAAGKRIAASDVLVQYCSITTYRKDIDVNGSPSKWTHTTGTGSAVLFRNGKRLTGTWVRKHYDGGTRFLTSGGKDMLLRPGQVWVVLVARGTRLSS